ncbi:cell division protein FtsX [Bacteroidia bacterium]|nr:cell division protein FtsX [Bacteroidia bacterium]
MATQEEHYQRKRLRKSYIGAIFSITLVLFLLGIVGIILIHANQLSRYVRENIIVTALLKDDARATDVTRLQKQLDFSTAVKSTVYVSKEDAAIQLTEQLGEDFIDFIGYNPLSATIIINLNAEYANNDSLAILEQQLMQHGEIQEVTYQKNLIQKINDNIKIISTGLLGFSVLLLLIAIALIHNTIRLSVYAKRLLIKSMQLVGATRRFISKPFIRRGITQGIVGAFVSCSLIAAGLVLLHNYLPDVFSIQNIDFYLLLFVVLFVISLLLTWLSSFFSVRRFLKMDSDRIYF